MATNMCEKCGERYTATSSVLDRGLCRKCANPGLGTAGLLELSDGLLKAAAVAEAERPARDYFISYYGAQEEQAARIDQVVRAMGRSTWFFDQRSSEAESYLEELPRTLEQSTRMVCVLSPGYFHSPRCLDELKAMWSTFHRDEERRILFLEVGPCQVPRLYQALRRTNLMDTTDEEYEGKIQEAIESAERQFTDYGEVLEEHDEPWAQLLPPPKRRLSGRGMFLAAVAMVLMSISYLTYFRYGPLGVWDLREAATYATLGRDISLPWNWAIASTNLHEYVSAAEAEAVDHWRRPGGLPSEFESAGQFLRPVGISLLRSTLPEAGEIEGGIAQYRAVFAGQSISLVADARKDGRAYRGFRLENDRQGNLTAAFFEKQAGGGETTLKTYPRKQLGAGPTLHDIGLSKKDGFYTLWHNRAVLATWSPQDQSRTRAGWKGNQRGGAFGLAVNGSSLVRLFRWSLSATLSGGDAVAVAQVRPQRPQLVSYFAMPGNRWLRDEEESWPESR